MGMTIKKKSKSGTKISGKYASKGPSSKGQHGGADYVTNTVTRAVDSGGYKGSLTVKAEDFKTIATYDRATRRFTISKVRKTDPPQKGVKSKVSAKQGTSQGSSSKLKLG
jgi:hypothetical protein